MCALNIGELRALQKNCEAGPELILTRLQAGSWHVDDVFEVLRLGLIGGGMPTGEAGPLVMRAFDEVAVASLKLPAFKVLSAALYGEAGDPVGEAMGVSLTETESGASRASMEPGQ